MAKGDASNIKVARVVPKKGVDTDAVDRIKKDIEQMGYTQLCSSSSKLKLLVVGFRIPRGGESGKTQKQKWVWRRPRRRSHFTHFCRPQTFDEMSDELRVAPGEPKIMDGTMLNQCSELCAPKGVPVLMGSDSFGL